MLTEQTVVNFVYKSSFLRVDEVENSFDKQGCLPRIGGPVAGSTLGRNTLWSPGNSERHHASNRLRSRGRALGCDHRS